MTTGSSRAGSRGGEAAAITIVADGTVPEVRAAGARQPVIVQGGYNGYPRIPARMEYRHAQ